MGHFAADSGRWQRMNKIVNLALVTAVGIISAPIVVFCLIFCFLLAAYTFTLAQWIINGYDFYKPKTRKELEHHIFFKTAHHYGSFTNLEYGMMHYWDKETGIYKGGTRDGDYKPVPGDKYYCYKVLGIMPIDAVFDSNDNVKIVFQTFDH